MKKDAYKVVSGKVEVLGQKTFNQVYTTYAYLRILESSGNVIMLKNVIVLNTVDSYLEPGAGGDFYLHAHPKGKKNYLFAYASQERAVINEDELEGVYKAIKKQAYKLLFLSPLTLLLVFLFGIGLIIFPIVLIIAIMAIKEAEQFKPSVLLEYFNNHRNP